MVSTVHKVESEIINAFANAAGFLGYSDVHGKILATLLITQRTLSLDEMARKTEYSASMISLSLDLLEAVGLIKKIKKPKDRKLYIKLQGDLLKALKSAIILKLQKELFTAKTGFELYRGQIKLSSDKDKKTLLKSLNNLEKEVNRIEEYLNLLAEVEVPQ